MFEKNIEQRQFSIIIPTWNNLKFLKLCIRSIRQNSKADHQIIVHVNEGTDGTLDWVKSQNLDYTYSERNIGVCMACNAMRRKVKTDYILYLNDDMYLLPGWDCALNRELDNLPDDRFFLSGTMIQPHNYLDVGITANYGDSIESFDEERLLREYMSFKMSDWRGATWPPNLMHRDMWDLIGGYSIEFSPGMYSDPDLTAKLYMAGVRHFKGLSDCRVYHFETKSTSRVLKNDGHTQFLFKWGFPNSMLRCNYTGLGLPFDDPDFVPKKAKHASRLKLLLTLLRGKRVGCPSFDDNPIRIE